MTVGSAAQVAHCTRRLGDRPAVMADAFLLESGAVDEIVGALATTRILGVAPGEPTVATVAAAARSVPGDTDVVVAVGGGSTLDTAKLAAALAHSELTDHLLSGDPFPGAIPVVAVPTTAGSGAEVTRTAVVTADGRKSWAWDEALRPTAAVLDAALTLRLPDFVTVASGLDAFVHALEAATARTRNVDGETAARWAVGQIHTGLPRVIEAPEDEPERRRMLVAAAAAGVGIDRCGTGVGHALGHALGSLAPVPHGLAVMLGTLVSIDWSVDGSGHRYGPVASSLDGTARAGDVPELVRRLAADVGFEERLQPAAAGVPLSPALIEDELRAVDHRPMLDNAARPVLDEDLAWLAERTAQAWHRIGTLR